MDEGLGVVEGAGLGLGGFIGLALGSDSAIPRPKRNLCYAPETNPKPSKQVLVVLAMNFLNIT